ncbi:hypothetical protein TCON_0373 [Astathelohania contejeani]|uniref:Uncharacterized protein n=1 Tax=Astathelohania contejeani TaxID=164912 RepID=A0ABQ7I1V0_9MICR|nr:hypothetical protein TCON_0373 [Thelohania contejeani]
MIFFLCWCLCKEKESSSTYQFIKISEHREELQLLRTVESTTHISRFYTLPSDPPSRYVIQASIGYMIRKLYTMDTPIVRKIDDTHFIIHPFGSITMERDGTKWLIGTYSSGRILGDVYIAEYTGGDKCDLDSTIRMRATVRYELGVNPLNIDRMKEKKLCEFEFCVSGSCLGKYDRNGARVYYTEEEKI